LLERPSPARPEKRSGYGMDLIHLHIDLFHLSSGEAVEHDAVLSLWGSRPASMGEGGSAAEALGAGWKSGALEVKGVAQESFKSPIPSEALILWKAIIFLISHYL